MKVFCLGALLSGALLISGCGAKKVKSARMNYPPAPSPASPAPRTTTPRPTPLPARIPQTGETENGVASWYGEPYHGRRAANGEIYDMEQLTAAHRTLPFNTWVRVQNLTNDLTVDVRITDRGPFVGDRIIDLSRAAARQISMIGPGIAQVRLTILQAPEVVPSRDGFGVQVGAFRDQGNAQRLQERMAQIYGSARTVQRADSPGVWRVVVGGCGTMEQAEQLAVRLRTEFAQCYVVRTEMSTGLVASSGCVTSANPIASDRSENIQ